MRLVAWNLHALEPSDLIIALHDSEPGVRERAILASEKLVSSQELFAKLASMTGDADARVRMQLAFSLGEFPPSEARLAALQKILGGYGQDRWIRTAVFSSLGTEAAAALKALAADETMSPAAAFVALPELADLVARRTGSEDGWKEMAAVVSQRSADPALQVKVLQAVYSANKAAQQSPAFAELTTELISNARTKAVDAELDEAVRGSALSALTLSTYAADGPLLLSSLDNTQPPAVQNAALATLIRFSDDAIATELLTRWPGLSPKLAERVRDGLLSRTSWSIVLLDAIATGTLAKTTLTQSDLQRLTDLPDEGVRSRAIKLLESMAGSSRDEVIRAYQVSLTLKGDRERGAALFKQNCSTCHQIGSVGNQVGPNLATMKNRGPEAILTNVLDPNREVNPAWRDYVAVTVDGTTHNGVLVSESASTLTLRRAEAKETSLLRADLEALRDTGRSLMPEGLEKNLDPQAMADLVTWMMLLE